MKLPAHTPTPVLAPPLMFTGLGFYELAAWHMYFRNHNELDRCREVEKAVSELPACDQRWIKKLNFYKPINS